MVMVKPALPYLDVISACARPSHVPVAAYNVSGEYAAIKAAAERGWINERAGRPRVAHRDPAGGRRHDRHLPRQGGRRVATRVGGAVPKLRSREHGAAVPLTDGDRHLLNLLQSSFPLGERPFAAIAKEASEGERVVREEEIMERTRGFSTSGSSGRSRRSSTRPRSATARCWSPRTSTRRTRSGLRR